MKITLLISSVNKSLIVCNKKLNKFFYFNFFSLASFDFFYSFFQKGKATWLKRTINFVQKIITHSQRIISISYLFSKKNNPQKNPFSFVNK